MCYRKHAEGYFYWKYILNKVRGGNILVVAVCLVYYESLKYQLTLDCRKIRDFQKSTIGKARSI